MSDTKQERFYSLAGTVFDRENPIIDDNSYFCCTTPDQAKIAVKMLNTPNTKPAQKECKWFQDEYNQSYYDTFCGQSWEFGDGDTVKNGMNYCHSCGGKVAAVKHKPEEVA